MPDIQSPAKGLAQKRRQLSPNTEAAFQSFSQTVFADGALPAKVKQIIAVAVAHVTQCPYCIKGHTKAALRHGASQEELMEAIWVAAKCEPEGLTLILFSQLRKWKKLRRRRMREATTIALDLRPTSRHRRISRNLCGTGWS